MRLFYLSLMLALAGCNAFGVVTPSMQAKFDQMPDKQLCGYFFELEYFTGQRKVVFAGTRNAALNVIKARNLQCRAYYNELIEDNRLGQIAHEKSRANNATDYDALQKAGEALQGIAGPRCRDGRVPDPMNGCGQPSIRMQTNCTENMFGQIVCL